MAAAATLVAFPCAGAATAAATLAAFPCAGAATVAAAAATLVAFPCAGAATAEAVAATSSSSSLNMMAASLNVGSAGVMLAAAAAFLALAAAMGLGTCGVMPVAVLAGGAATGLVVMMGPGKDPRHACTIKHKGLQVPSKLAKAIRKKRK